MTLLHNIMTVSFVTLAVFQPGSANAANCTDKEQSTIDSVYNELTKSTTCADLISNSDTTSLDYCNSSDCIAKLSATVDQLPDCTGDDEIDRKTGLQAIVTYCADVTKVMGQSASGAGSDIVSSASSGVLAVCVLVAQLSVALYFFAGML
ncbi:unnamed protein product [Peronospora farinosa]|uniref:Elicitin n=1 Tax=Peronospora farinosa TaxID=134698 RepID=A0AAV0TUA3_9STRA|nr:unnamed protein product [Peronospora farinosa]CAI5727527.1 unnamed protein product [Peronospora farinosa]